MSDEEPRTVVIDGRVRDDDAADLVPTLTVLEGPDVGSFYSFDNPGPQHRIGRAEDADLRINAPSVSRYHAICEVKRRGEHQGVFLFDNGSTNGLLVNGNPAREGWLIAGDKIRLGDVLLRFQWMAEDEVAYHSGVNSRIRAGERDHLTGLLTRAWLTARLPEELEDWSRRGRPVSCFLMDLDHFKSINDQWGHLVGDAVIESAAGILTAVIGDGGYGLRYGGEEFLAVLPGLVLLDAQAAAERCRRELQRSRVADLVGGTPVTGSFGVAEWSQGEEIGAWIERADRALYRAKAAGRDCVEASPDPKPLFADTLRRKAEDF